MLDKIIFFIHVICLILGVLIPLVGSREHLNMYSLIIPFLFFHWAMNDDTCALTILESWATDKPKDRTFVGRVLGPIYNLGDDQAGKLVKGVLFAMWMLVQYKLGRLFS